MTSIRRVLAPIAAIVIAFSAVGAPAQAAPDSRQLTAEIFATNNTAIITDPQDPRLRTKLGLFGAQVTLMICEAGGIPRGTQLLAGVFWSDDLKKATYEASREFHVGWIGADGLHHLAGQIAKRYHQESVLTFRYLPSDSAQADGIEVEVAGVTVQRLHDALVANPELRESLGGGSVTESGDLILIAQRADLAQVHKFVTALGADWTTAKTRFGTREFVPAEAQQPVPALAQ